MNRLVYSGIIMVLAIACQSGPRTIDNTARATVVWRDKISMCLEYSTAASLLKERDVKLSADVKEYVSAEVSFRSADSLAQIYTVSEIMQFGHAALYRLCEARANGALDDKTYAANLAKVLDDVKGLLQIQANQYVTAPMVRAQYQLALLNDRLAKAKVLQDEKTKTPKAELQSAFDEECKRAKELRDDLDKMKLDYGLPLIVPSADVCAGVAGH